MFQPPGFVDETRRDHVCLLKRSLYGLKQAPRAWYQWFASYLYHLGFVSSKCDTSLFIYKQGTSLAYLLLYVVDIVLTASSDSLCSTIIAKLSSEFAMTDLDPLSFFLGVSATRFSSCIFLTQEKYAKDIVERADMSNCKPAQTPADTASKLGASCGPTVADVS